MVSIYTQMNGSNKAVILLHEIYGVNEHMIATANLLTGQGYDVYAPNLLHRDSFLETEQQAAYQYFIEQVGFENAVQQALELAHSLRDQYETIVIWGYSVGATTAWLCSEHDHVADAVIGYYGSRIREYLHISPKIPVYLLFSKEKSFHVNDLVDQLATKPMVNTQVCEAEHGFSNPNSIHYRQETDKQAFEESLRWINYVMKQQ
ncbi:dienelactone hydrolase family protein [Bacillus sp. FJAT-52991]|uniref:Dienelactone hydrolase family protein n=1 Tax=Bacillus kandeliae TaxID=3129297 RepID=A0ABZ2N272_9BACI